MTSAQIAMPLAAEWYEWLPSWLGVVVGGWVAIAIGRAQSRDSIRIFSLGQITEHCFRIEQLVRSAREQHDAVCAQAGRQDERELSAHRVALLQDMKALSGSVHSLICTCRRARSKRLVVVLDRNALRGAFLEFKDAVTGSVSLITGSVSDGDAKAALADSSQERLLQAVARVRLSASVPG